MVWFDLNLGRWMLLNRLMYLRQRLKLEPFLDSLVTIGISFLIMLLLHFLSQVSPRKHKSQGCVQVFNQLKELLCCSLSPNFSRPYILQTDTIDRGVGAIRRMTVGMNIQWATTVGNCCLGSKDTPLRKWTAGNQVSHTCVSCLSAWSSVSHRNWSSVTGMVRLIEGEHCQTHTLESIRSSHTIFQDNGSADALSRTWEEGWGGIILLFIVFWMVFCTTWNIGFIVLCYRIVSLYVLLVVCVNDVRYLVKLLNGADCVDIVGLIGFCIWMVHCFIQ